VFLKYILFWNIKKYFKNFVGKVFFAFKKWTKKMSKNRTPKYFAKKRGRVTIIEN
jgi:hypothetical protein